MLRFVQSNNDQNPIPPPTLAETLAERREKAVFVNLKKSDGPTILGVRSINFSRTTQESLSKHYNTLEESVCVVNGGCSVPLVISSHFFMIVLKKNCKKNAIAVAAAQDGSLYGGVLGREDPLGRNYITYLQQMLAACLLTAT